ncbi:hypothetical protein ACFX13_016750 [Malus domestica]
MQLEETLKPRVECIGGTRSFLSSNLRHAYGESIVIIELLTTPQKQGKEPGKTDQGITFDLYLHPYPNEPRWQTGYSYTPADAIARSLKTLSLNDVRVLSRTISEWFKGFED